MESKYAFFVRMLGYTGGTHTMRSQFGTVNSTFAMDDVKCLGNETTILACPHTTREDCSASEGAGVICAGIFSSPLLPILFIFNSQYP